jgi:hypothetical protein
MHTHIDAGSPVGAAATAHVNKEFVLAKADYFMEVHLWPLHNQLNPQRWLSNFHEPEMEHAVHLLNAFLYFSKLMMEQLFVAAFQDLSRRLFRPHDTYFATRSAWQDFMNRVIITRVTGESPNDTDSSFAFARMARQVLAIRQEQILSPEDALQVILARGPQPVVFVDDFAGSGRQFIETWRREFPMADGANVSFARLASIMNCVQLCYCPLICTEYAKTRIVSHAGDIILSPAHLLPACYSALARDSVIWPEHLRTSAASFVRTASIRAGIPEGDWRGFHDLGLALAFEGCIPDASLPLFYWEHNGWQPLMRKV